MLGAKQPFKSIFHFATARLTVLLKKSRYRKPYVSIKFVWIGLIYCVPETPRRITLARINFILVA